MKEKLEELALWFFIIFVVLPIVAMSLISHIVVKLIKTYRKRKESGNTAELFVYTENTEYTRKFNGSEILFIIGTVFIILSGIAFGVAGWVNTTSVGRVMIMLLATAVMFGAGVLFHKVIKLDGTSTAFCSIGTVLLSVTVITAGYYRLFGEWLSVHGDGWAMLFALSSAVMALTAFAEYKFLEKDAFLYISLMSVSVTLIFLSAQVAESYGDFAVMMILLQSVISAGLYIFGLSEEKSLRITGNISAVVFAVLAFVKVMISAFNPDGATYLIMIVITAQLLGYGIYLKNPTLKGLQSVSSILTLFIFVSDSENILDSSETILIFAIVSMFIYVTNRFVPCLKNSFSEIFTLFFAVYGSVDAVNHAVIVPVIMSLLIMSYAFAEKKSVQVLAGLASPIMPLIIGANFRCDIYNIIAVALCLITALIVFLPKYNFELYVKFPRKTDVILYTNMITAGMILMFSTTDSPENPFSALIICILYIAVSSAMRNNWTGAFSVIGIINLVTDVTYDSDNLIYIRFLVFCSMMVLSRIFFRDGIVVRKNNKTKTDIIMFAEWYSLFDTAGYGKSGNFLCMICIALYIANFVRKNTSKNKASVLLSISTFITTVAFINRPFLIVESEMVSSKITLAIITLMGIAYKYIWKNNPRASKVSSETIFIIAFVGLIYDALDFQTLSNTIFVLAVTAVVLMISFATKSKTWFSVSSVAIVTITVYATRKYFASLDWWVYLFIAGLIFIVIASLNEYLKKSGKTIGMKVSEMFSGWKW